MLDGVAEVAEWGHMEVTGDGVGMMDAWSIAAAAAAAAENTWDAAAAAAAASLAAVDVNREADGASE